MSKLRKSRALQTGTALVTTTRRGQRRRQLGDMVVLEEARKALGLTETQMCAHLGYRSNGLWQKWQRNGVPKVVELAAHSLVQRNWPAATPSPTFGTVQMPDGKRYLLVPLAD